MGWTVLLEQGRGFYFGLGFVAESMSCYKARVVRCEEGSSDRL